MTERRTQPRIAKVLDATWHALSGNAPCRVTDISVQGCFVDAVLAPQVNDETDVTVAVGDTLIRLQGRVRYVEPRLGFGLRFNALTEVQRNELRPILSA